MDNSKEQQKKPNLLGLVMHWNAGRTGTITVFVGAVLVMGFFAWGMNEAVAALDGLPDAKFKATVGFALAIVSILTFVE